MIGVAKAIVAKNQVAAAGGLQPFTGLFKNTATNAVAANGATPVADGVLVALSRTAIAAEPRYAKLGLDGSLTWLKQIAEASFTGAAHCYTALELAGGDQIVLAHGAGTMYETLLLRVDNNTVIWQKRLSNTSHVFGRQAHLLPNGNIAILVQSAVVVWTPELIIFQPDGTLVAHKRFSASVGVSPYSMDVTATEIVISNHATPNGYIVHTALDGSGATFTKFSVPETLYINSVSVDEATGDTYLAGRGRLGVADNNGWVAKFNSAGVNQWSKSFSIAGEVQYDNLMATFNDGALYLSGFLRTLAAPQIRGLTAKISSAGVPEWAGTYNKSTNNSAFNYQGTNIEVVNGNLLTKGYVSDGVLDAAVISTPIDGSHVGTTQNGIAITSVNLEVADVVVTAETNDMVDEGANLSTINSTITAVVSDATDLTYTVA